MFAIYMLQLLSAVVRVADGRRVVWAGHSTIVVRRLYVVSTDDDRRTNENL